MITDSGNSENIVSKTMFDKLKFKKHSSSYYIGWIKDVRETKVTEKCYIPFSIRRYKVSCIVADMNACHLLLRRP